MTTMPEEPAGVADPRTAEEAVLAAAADVLEAAEEAEPVAALDLLDNPRRVLFVHAHPDDETISNAATMATYVARGAQVTLVTCTLGEEGDVLVPELAHLAADRDGGLGQHRLGELATAMEALAVTDFRFLGGPGRYRDSGMMGLPTNGRPDAFWSADVDEAAGHLVDVLREVRPQVVVTYDDKGGYGHPDHIQAHRVTMRAVALAADPTHGPGEPWQVLKVYWNVVPRSVLEQGLAAMRAEGRDFFGVASVDELPFAAPDELVTTEVDGTGHIDAKMAAMRAHATQIQLDGPFFALSNAIGLQIWGVEHYRLVAGELGPVEGSPPRERDLFAGIAG